jgi:hypothetical protein
MDRLLGKLTDANCIQMTKTWIDRVVIQLNLCPFAKSVFDSGRIRYVVLSDITPASAVQTFISELGYLVLHESIETTLVIFPTLNFEFTTYLNLVDAWDLEIDSLGHRGIFQLASFHPEYQFEGASMDDPENFTNRSPLPMVHILRESSIEEALRKYPRPELIPETNIKRMKSLGLERIRDILSGCSSDFVEKD